MNLADLFARKEIRIRVKQCGETWYAQIFSPNEVTKRGKFRGWRWAPVGHPMHRYAFKSESDALGQAKKEVGQLKEFLIRARQLNSNRGWREIDCEHIMPQACDHEEETHGCVGVVVRRTEEDEAPLPGERRKH